MIFDDFYDSLHQYRALVDYCSAYLRSFRIIGMTKQIARAAIQINEHAFEAVQVGLQANEKPRSKLG